MRGIAGEQLLVDTIGAWVAREVFGPIGSALATRGGEEVRVRVPPGADWLFDRPLELGLRAATG